MLAGMVFLLSGLGKLGNVLEFQRLIVDYGLSTANLLAPLIILAEILIGSLLIFNTHNKAVSSFACVLIVIFTIAYTYAWRFHGITDCGCFGKYIPLTSSPWLTYIRNLVLFILLSITFLYGSDTSSIADWKQRIIFTIMFAATFVAGMSYRPFAFIERKHPIEYQPIAKTQLLKFRRSTNNQSELIFFFSYSCPHCINSMENLKAWKESKAVSQISAYVVVDSIDTQLDSMRILFKQRFPTISISEADKDMTNFVDAYPTAFIIVNDTIRHVVVGELPSHYLFDTPF